ALGDDEHTVASLAQWTASPMYFATWTSLNGSGFAAVSCASAELAPNTVGTSTAAFSSTMFAVEKSPTVQPARVKGTHGAGVIWLVSPSVGGVVSEYTIDGAVSFGFGTGGLAFVSMIGEVQYVKDVFGSVVPFGL